MGFTISRCFKDRRKGYFIYRYIKGYIYIYIFARFGFPHSLKSDNGKQFVSEDFQRFLLEANIEHRTSPPLWSQANGKVERRNRTLRWLKLKAKI